MITTELQSALQWGTPVDAARAAIVLLHGRGGSAADMRGFARSFERPGFAFLAPEAAGQTWYPYPFTALISRNEPYLSQALDRVRVLLAELDQAGVPASHTLLLGFSQGACLALEFASRHLDCCAATVGLSGGLIGPRGTIWDAGNRKTDMLVFLGCGDRDPHIAAERVDETASFFESAGATVEKRIYPGMGHQINHDEIQQIERLMAKLQPD